MKKIALSSILILTAFQSYADTLLSDNFDSYTIGDLVPASATASSPGQGTWFQTGNSSGAAPTNPIQVTAGATVGSTVTLQAKGGQDIYSPFTNGAAASTTGGFAVKFSLDVTSAASGDYFLHLGVTAGTTQSFWNKIFVKKDPTAGYELGISGSSNTAGYGTIPLTIGTTYQVLSVYNADTNALGLYINPTSVDGSTDTPYVIYSETAGEISFKPATLASVNFRQGSSTASPGVVIDDLSVYTVTTLLAPEPSTMGAFVLGGGLLLFRRRRAAAVVS